MKKPFHTMEPWAQSNIPINKLQYQKTFASFLGANLQNFGRSIRWRKLVDLAEHLNFRWLIKF
jgi:hypothetical protein